MNKGKSLTKDQIELCAFIREFRLKHELTVRALAELLRVSDRSIQLWERLHHAPYGQRLIRIRRLIEAYENMDMRDRKSFPRKIGGLKRPGDRDQWERKIRNGIEKLKTAEAQVHGRTNP